MYGSERSTIDDTLWMKPPDCGEGSIRRLMASAADEPIPRFFVRRGFRAVDALWGT